MKKRRECVFCHTENKFTIKYKLSAFNIIKCSHCSLLSRDLILTDLKVKNLYSKAYFCELQKNYFSAGLFQAITTSSRYHDFKTRLKKISRYCNLKKGLLLDVGCGTGVFLKAAKDAGWQVKGLEISEFASNFAKKTFNLAVLQGKLEKLNYPTDFFDIVTCWDVIEHAERPDKLIKESKKIIKTGGYLVLQTMQTDSLPFLLADMVYRFSFGKIKYPINTAYPLHHAHHFSKKILSQFLKNNGFDIIVMKNVEMSYKETSLPIFTLPFFKILSLFSILTGKTIEFFIIAKKI